MIDVKDGSNILFICGAGHSGTTLLLAIMDSHKNISSIPHETGVFHKFEESEDIRKVVSTWKQKYLLSDSLIYAEKTPVHSIYLDKIFRVFPKARVLFIVRDGRDSTLSEAKRLGDYLKAVKAWVKFNSKALPFFDDKRVFVIKYEELVNNKENVLKEVCQFLNIDFDAQMLDHSSKRRTWWDSDVRQVDKSAELVGENHKINRNWQINQPVFKDSISRWRLEMSDNNKATFKDKAGDLLIKLGYVTQNEIW